MEKRYGLLGRTLGHSRSPMIHKLLADYDYQLFETEPEKLDAFFLKKDFAGINVTIPYKQQVIPYLSELSPVAERIGAVNTVVKRADGSLFGENTDYYGFVKMLERAGAVIEGKKCVVLGSGGASRMAVTALKDLGGASVTVISRNGVHNYENIYEEQGDADVLVNTTPVGMYPDIHSTPVDVTRFRKLSGVYDLVYNPRPTRLLQEGAQAGIPVSDGLYMLVAQAKMAAELFTGEKIPEKRLEEVFEKMKDTL